MSAVEINGITGVEAATRRIATQNDCHDGQDKANARLIAARPELLDAAKAVPQIGWYAHNPWRTECGAAAAIAKAEAKYTTGADIDDELCRLT